MLIVLIFFFENSFTHQSTLFQPFYQYFFSIYINSINQYIIIKIKEIFVDFNTIVCYSFQHLNTNYLSSFPARKRWIIGGTIFNNFWHKNLVIHYPRSKLESYNFDGFLRKIIIKNCYKLFITFSSRYQQRFSELLKPIFYLLCM